MHYLHKATTLHSKLNGRAWLRLQICERLEIEIMFCMSSYRRDRWLILNIKNTRKSFMHRANSSQCRTCMSRSPAVRLQHFKKGFKEAWWYKIHQKANEFNWHSSLGCPSFGPLAFLSSSADWYFYMQKLAAGTLYGWTQCVLIKLSPVHTSSSTRPQTMAKYQRISPAGSIKGTKKQSYCCYVKPCQGRLLLASPHIDTGSYHFLQTKNLAVFAELVCASIFCWANITFNVVFVLIPFKKICLWSIYTSPPSLIACFKLQFKCCSWSATLRKACK